MRRQRRKFTDEFKAEAVAPVMNLGVPISEVAKDLDLTESALRLWAKAAKPKGGLIAGSDLSESERDELKSLRKEVRILHEERTMLRKPRRSLRWRVSKIRVRGEADGRARRDDDVPAA